MKTIESINKIVEDMIWAELSKRTYQCSCEKRDISSSVMLKKDWVEFTKPLSMKITQQILSLIEELERKVEKLKPNRNDCLASEWDGWKRGYYKAKREMRASIREFFEIKD